MMRTAGRYLAIAMMLVGVALLLLITGAVGGASGATITVPDDYPTIQSAIDNATDYDTLFVKDGLYQEAVVVYRPLTIMGESHAGTVISFEDPFAVLIVAGKVNLSNVTVQMTRTGAGLILQGSYCVIEDVTVRQSIWGLWVNRGYHNVVRNVRCIDNDWQGVLVEEADHTLLEGVTCTGNNEGIHVRGAVNTTIRDSVSRDNRVHGLLVQSWVDVYPTRIVKVQRCDIINNDANGMEFSDVDHIIVEDCTVEESNWSAIRADGCNDVTIRSCRVVNYTRIGIGVQREVRKCLIEDNTVFDAGTSWSDVVVHGTEHAIIRNNYVKCRSSAISVLWANHTLVSDNIVESTSDNASLDTNGIIVGRHRAGVDMPPTNVTLLRNEVSRFTVGIWVRGGWDIDIIDCTVREAEVGIELSVFNAGDDPMVGGTVMGCTLVGCGIVIEGMMDVTVEGNTVQGAPVGILFNATSHAIMDNVFISNTIKDCSEHGLYFNGTNGTNMFHLNSFINNTEHSSVPFDDDSFDDGMYGNYWDDYRERYPAATAVGRVWDTAYEVAMSTVLDRYPLAVAHDPVPPVADAGEDQRVLAGAEVLLFGGASTDNVGVVNYTWSYSVGDDIFRFHGKEVSISLVGIGSYDITLEARDAWGNTAADAVVVEVYDDVEPVADAGDDITVGMGDLFTLDANGSTDNGIIASYTWVVDPIGLDIRIERAFMGLSLSTPGDYPVVLTVTDEGGNVDTDMLTVHVLDTEPPVARAGGDILTKQGRNVTLEDLGSTDNIGIMSWVWTFLDGEEPVSLEGIKVFYRFNHAGEVVVTLNVSDEAGNWDTDWMAVTVQDGEAPVAVAGADRWIDQGQSVLFDASGSTDNVGIEHVVWSFAEGSRMVYHQESLSTHRFDEPGEYQVRLTVYDRVGNSAFDTLWVHVNATSRQWELGMFRDDEGPLGGVRVEVILNDIVHVAYTDDEGEAMFVVVIADLVSPATVKAEKEGWQDLSFDMTLNENGDPTGTVPVMERVAGDGGDGDEDDGEGLEEWLPWALVIVLVIAFVGTLLYLSSVARWSGEG